MHVLVAEQDQQLAAAIARALRRDGVTVDLATDGTRALAMSNATLYDLIILDRELRCRSGSSVSKQLQDRGCGTRILVLPEATTLQSDERSSIAVHPKRSFDLDRIVVQVRALDEALRTERSTEGRMQRRPR